MPIGKPVREVRDGIAALADAARAGREDRYFKGTIRSHGLTVPQTRAVAREVFRAHRGQLPAVAWLAAAEELLATGWFQEGNAGLEWVILVRLPATSELFGTYERWLLTYVGNWAHCDTLAVNLIGPMLLARPELVARLVPWTASENGWARRASAVSLVPPLRRGLLWREALDIATRLLGERDDLVQKGVGWMLRELAGTHRAEVVAFLEAQTRRLPRTSLRYALERFPPGERRRLMAL